MKVEDKRIFISDLPETLTQEELQQEFSKYGHVQSVEIKERKNLGSNKSLFFSYITLSTDDKTLTRCFRDFGNSKWHGEYLQLQLARESFLDRLKREREENAQNKNVEHTEVETKIVAEEQNYIKKNTDDNQNSEKKPSRQGKLNGHRQLDGEESDALIQAAKRLKLDESAVKTNKFNDTNSLKIKPSVSQSSDDSSSEDYNASEQPQQLKLEEPIENIPDFTIKSNRHKLGNKGSLKIESFGFEPVAVISKKNHKLQSDNKSTKVKLEALKEQKNRYEQQKNLIRNALYFGAARPNKKISFETSEDTNEVGDKTENGLFDGDDSDEGVDFTLKEQFEGTSGYKLLELQSKYKNDSRFVLDKRFLEPEIEDTAHNEGDQNDFEAEKNQQFKIMEDIFGTKLTKQGKSIQKNNREPLKSVIRYDPTNPKHEELTKRPETEKEQNKMTEEKVDEPKKPKVSQELFYTVSNNLKEALTDKAPFSLLSTFGHEQPKTIDNEQEILIGRSEILNGKNPFRYDSSDDDDNYEIEDVPHKESTNNASKAANSVQAKMRPTNSVPSVWSEPFFFQPNDYRYQEATDFLEKIKNNQRERQDYSTIRREIKRTVKQKMKNNERNDKMFKRKLGGNKRRKNIRIKKALKR